MLYIYFSIFQNNTFQAIIITDHSSKSYAIFTFYCGDLNWARGPTIGYNAASAYYANHPDTGADDADNIDCINGPNTYYNVWYNISVEGFVTPSPPPPIEPGQLVCVNVVVLHVMSLLCTKILETWNFFDKTHFELIL